MGIHSVIFETEIDFSTPLTRRLGEETLNDYLATLVRRNVRLLEAYPDIPLLYQAGIRYQHEPPGVEKWQAIDRMLTTKQGDCEDLACALTAELIVRRGDKNAKPILTSRAMGNNARMYHIRTMHGDGTIEDPSKVLGMGRRSS